MISTISIFDMCVYIYIYICGHTLDVYIVRSNYRDPK